MNRVFGIETEYGITIDGGEAIDVVHESIEIVRSYTERGASMKWDYALEDPHCDARGFRAAELLQDTDEADYYEADQKRPMSFTEIKSDLVLANGARFYNDHAHPEYSTPECTTLAEIVAQDRAGERVLAECARRRQRHLPAGQQVRLYKNNTDFVGHSYGCHDNYLLRRDVPWERVVAVMTPFLVTRQIFAGAGKIGIETESSPGQAGVFQLSQRADFFSVLVSIDTMNRRPIVNTRDEPHADAAKFRRLHVIIGDANRSEWATAMKLGTTALVLAVLEAGAAPDCALRDPIAALKEISRDPSQRWLAERARGGTISAVEIQRRYLEAARAVVDAADPEVAWLLAEWEQVLAALETDPATCGDRVDWVAKRFLLETLREAEHLEWDDPWLQAIDLQYHDVGETDLFAELEKSGQMRRLTTEVEVERAIHFPPLTTRAFFRGRSVARFQKQISSVQWDELVFEEGERARSVPLDQPAFDARLTALNELIRTAPDFAKFRQGLV